MVVNSVRSNVIHLFFHYGESGPAGQIPAPDVLRTLPPSLWKGKAEPVITIARYYGEHKEGTHWKKEKDFKRHLNRPQ